MRPGSASSWGSWSAPCCWWCCVRYGCGSSPPRESRSRGRRRPLSLRGSMRLDSALAQRPQWGSGAIRGVLHWYVPYFNACSFPLARRNEFEADASSVQLTSADSAAQALTNVSVIGSYLRERYWPAVGARARDTAQPAFAPYGALGASL